MDKLVSGWQDGKTLPESYIFPPGKRPGENVVLASKTIPVIDLGLSDEHDHKNVVKQIVEAAQEFGFFQVVNHGVERRVSDDAMRLFKEFFELPNEDKSNFSFKDHSQKCALYTSNTFYDKEELHLWRDALKHSCDPLEECIQHWPEKPDGYRQVAREYVVKVRELGSIILDLIGEGLGLDKGYFANGLTNDSVLIASHYPPCPDPSLTLGVPRHSDPGLITILLQGSVPGLQVLKDGDWIGVEPLPDAFVVNMGYQMQIVSNGQVKSVEHRAVTNTNEVRTSVALFISPAKDCIAEPATALINVAIPPLYKGVPYQEFFHKAYLQERRGEINNALEPYLIKA